jgi:biopolymer transport protein ExbB
VNFKQLIPAFLVLTTFADAHFSQEKKTFTEAATSVRSQLEASLAELASVRERAKQELVPLHEKLTKLELELSKAREDHEAVKRTMSTKALQLTNLSRTLEGGGQDEAYLNNLFLDFRRNFESRLHIAEVRLYEEALERARLAPEDRNLTTAQAHAAQIALLSTALGRLEAALGGNRFEGAAVDPTGSVNRGRFLLLGPAGLFVSADGTMVGTAEQRINSAEPAVVPFELPEQLAAAKQLLASGEGSIPLDPTLGNAHKIAEIEEPLIEHVKKGGPVMVPIFALAGAALLVALYKWVSMLFVSVPSRRRLAPLLEAVGRHDREAAVAQAQQLRGPVGQMLAAGAAHLGEPRELVEEIMYEKVLEAKLALQRWLPFVAITASSAPLLGLLGTVTGIMDTFALMTVFGTGDVKNLSGGISAALITTEYGLYVAIPALLLYAFLSRKARSVLDRMDQSAIAFLNEASRPQAKKPALHSPASHPQARAEARPVGAGA